MSAAGMSTASAFTPTAICSYKSNVTTASRITNSARSPSPTPHSTMISPSTSGAWAISSSAASSTTALTPSQRNWSTTPQPSSRASRPTQAIRPATSDSTVGPTSSPLRTDIPLPPSIPLLSPSKTSCPRSEALPPPATQWALLPAIAAMTTVVAPLAMATTHPAHIMTSPAAMSLTLTIGGTATAERITTTESMCLLPATQVGLLYEKNDTIEKICTLARRGTRKERDAPQGVSKKEHQSRKLLQTKWQCLLLGMSQRRRRRRSERRKDGKECSLECMLASHRKATQAGWRKRKMKGRRSQRTGERRDTSGRRRSTIATERTEGDRRAASTSTNIKNGGSARIRRARG